MTPTMTNTFPIERPSLWNVLFAEDSDRDLDFDEGFEEDELHESKPPSRRPLLWILLLVLIGGVAYWILNNPSPNFQQPTSVDSAMDSFDSITPEKVSEVQSDISPPLFREDQVVVLTEESMLMGDSTNSQPGPIVATGERMTIVDGSHQIQGWVYLVKTESGKTGWISGEKIK